MALKRKLRERVDDDVLRVTNFVAFRQVMVTKDRKGNGGAFLRGDVSAETAHVRQGPGFCANVGVSRCPAPKPVFEGAILAAVWKGVVEC